MSSGELVYLVVVPQGLLLCWVLSMAEAGTAIRIQPLPLWLCEDEPPIFYYGAVHLDTTTFV